MKKNGDTSKNGKAARVSRRIAFPVVGIGSSAGGLEAFTQLLQHLPVDTGMAFIFVQHLDHEHESALPHILGRATTMPVREAAQGMRVAPTEIYVIPPNSTLRLAQGRLDLDPREPSRALAFAGKHDRFLHATLSPGVERTGIGRIHPAAMRGISGCADGRVFPRG